VLASILGQDTSYPEIFHGIPSSFQENTEILFDYVMTVFFQTLFNSLVILPSDAVQSRSAIFNRCAAKGPQMCGGSLGEGRKEARKN
jgi:hypothetical protein